MRRACLVLLALAMTALGAEPQFREVTGCLLDLEGKPAFGVQVTLQGLERDALGFGSNNPESPPSGWRFTTDKDGRFTARFGQFKSYDHEQATGEQLPGWGSFYFIASKDGTAGAVSYRIENYPEKPQDSVWVPDGKGTDEWSIGRIVRLHGERTEITMQFERGIRVSGRVEDAGGKPLPGIEVGVQHDLHVWSHTGYGGGIFEQKMMTDASGRFSFDHVYPKRFDLIALPGNEPPIWMRTKVHGRWHDEIIDSITPEAKERVVEIVIMASRELPCRYFGRVTNEAGKGIAQAKITLGISRHRQIQTHADDHTFLYAKTDNEGRWELRTPTPFVRFFRAEAAGFKESLKDFESNETMAKPGEYDFKMSGNPPE